MAILILVLTTLAACQPDAGAKPLGVLPGVPVPADAVVDLGGGSAAIDGDRQFVAYRSTAAPAAALKRFDTQLKTAGYRSIGRRTGWTCYVRGNGKATGDVVLVYVEPDGPPTTLLVAAGTFADVALANGPGQNQPGTPGLGTPDPTSAIKSHPAGGRGSGGGSGNGGNGQGGAGGQGTGNGQGSGGGNGSGSGGGSEKTPKPKPSPTPRLHPDQSAPRPNAAP